MIVSYNEEYWKFKSYFIFNIFNIFVYVFFFVLFILYWEFDLIVLNWRFLVTVIFLDVGWIVNKLGVG